MQEGASTPIRWRWKVDPRACAGLPAAGPQRHRRDVAESLRVRRTALLMREVYGADILGPAVDEVLQRTLARMSADYVSRLTTQVGARAARWRPHVAGAADRLRRARGR